MMDENQNPEGDGEGLSKRQLLELWEQADDKMRERLKPFFQMVGMPIPFVLPAPPEEVTPALAVPAITTLIHKSQALLREHMRVILGIQKIDQNLANRMLSEAHQAQATYQQILQEIIAEIQHGETKELVGE